MANETIVAVYENFEAAKKAVENLTNDGISRDDIGLAVNNSDGKGEYSNLEANVEVASIVLSKAEIAEIGALVTPDQISGKRYSDAAMAETNR